MDLKRTLMEKQEETYAQTRKNFSFGSPLKIPHRPSPTSKNTAILPRTRGASTTLTPMARKPPRTSRAIPSPNNNLLPNLHNPLALQQLRRTRSPPCIFLKAPPQEIDALR